MSSTEKEEVPQLDWIQLHNELEAMHPTETMLSRMERKSMENPFIPIGCLATFSALVYGLWSFRQGKRKMSQYMMRTRIVAQGFTIMAFVVGLGMSASKAAKTT